MQPRATDHIDDMIGMIETLIAKGHAYAAENHVLFSVNSMRDYGRLSGRNRDEMIAGARVEVAPYKKDPADFVLWKPSTPDLPGWDSPWGRGRPGWHIECSAMSERHLGEHFDIHGGGIDLVFPHHENEIAQSVCAHEHPRFAEIWMHNGFLMTEGQKMSKSLGNFYTVGDLLDEFPGEAIRLLLLKSHYRQPQDFTKDGLREAKNDLDRLYRVLREAGTAPTREDHPHPRPLSPSGRGESTVRTALNDDLNTPAAITGLFALASRFFEAQKANRPDDARLAAEHLSASAQILGLLQSDPEAWFQSKNAQASINVMAHGSVTIEARVIYGPDRSSASSTPASPRARRRISPRPIASGRSSPIRASFSRTAPRARHGGGRDERHDTQDMRGYEAPS